MWAKATFTRPWTAAMAAAGVLGLAVSYVADQYPAWSALANRAAWQLPLVMFVVLLVPAALHGSFTLYTDVLERFSKAASEADELRERLVQRVNYGKLAEALSALHREASEGWIDEVPSEPELSMRWRPKVEDWFGRARAVLLLHDVPSSDLAHFEVVNNLDMQKFHYAIPEEVRRMWIRVERLGQLARKYEDRFNR